MFQLQILSGKQAGVLWDARRFPVTIGRAAGSNLQLEEEGVWDKHFRVELSQDNGFTLVVHPGAIVSVNQTLTEKVRLRNGDIITAGSVRLGFRVSATKQRGLKLREAFVWLLMAGITLGQAALICWLLG